MMKNNDKDELMYGSVIVTKGKHKGRIGRYDDDYYTGSCIVYFGELALANSHEKIRSSSLSNVIPTEMLLARIVKLRRLIGITEDAEDKFDLMLELEFCSNLLNTSYFNATLAAPSGLFKVFISLSSEDSVFARKLATDLKNAGYEYFFYDWSIGLGENILKKIGEGIEASSALIPVISQSFMKSVYCLDEWTSYYNKYAKTRPDSIYPVVIDDSDVPTLLAARKYVRVKDASDYSKYLNDLLIALKKQNS
jgi:hypothetical protein